VPDAKTMTVEEAMEAAASKLPYLDAEHWESLRAILEAVARGVPRAKGRHCNDCTDVHCTGAP